MVLTQLQTSAFFENSDQLGIPHETMVQIQREGIQVVADLADFEKQELQQLADNLRKPGGRIPDPNPNAADTFLSMFRLCSCGTKPQRSENHHFVMTSSWEPQCHHDIIMRTPRITGKLKFSWSGGP